MLPYKVGRWYASPCGTLDSATNNSGRTPPGLKWGNGMLGFAVRRREPECQPRWLADVDVAARLGIGRSTLWRWVDQGLVPQPIRVGRVQRSDGRTRSQASRWRAADIELFQECRNMAEFRRRKQD